MNKTHKVVAVGLASAVTLMVFALPQERRAPDGGAAPVAQQPAVVTSPETQPDQVFDMTFTSQRERIDSLSRSPR